MGGGMSKRVRITRVSAWVATGASVLMLAACDVQVHDDTPAEYKANDGFGMYDVKATVQRDALVSQGSVFLFGIGDKQRIELTSNRDGTEWHGLYSVRCHSSFPLQFLAVWKLQGLTTRQKLVPPQPRDVKLIEPPWTSQASIDTSGPGTQAAAQPAAAKGGRKAGGNKGGSKQVQWEGGVPYRIATSSTAHITAAHIEPLSQDPADVAAAKPISIASTFPMDLPCGAPAEIRVASTAQKAHGNLVIDTDFPAVQHWQTKVEFAPK
jgi:hypothetical protein